MGLLRKLFAWGIFAVGLGVLVLFARPSYRQGEPSIAGQAAEDFAMDLAIPAAAGMDGTGGVSTMAAQPIVASQPPNVAAQPGTTGQSAQAGLPAVASLPAKASKSMRLSDLRGKVVVLNFWASWCPPCVEEAPSLNRLQERIAPRGAVIIGVSIDEDPAQYEKFLKDFSVPFPTWRDPSAKIMHDYGTQKLPETYIIDRHGRIARKLIGFQNWDSPQLNAYFDYLLARS